MGFYVENVNFFFPFLHSIDLPRLVFLRSSLERSPNSPSSLCTLSNKMSPLPVPCTHSRASMMPFPLCGVHSPLYCHMLKYDPSAHVQLRRLIHDGVPASSSRKWPVLLLKSLGAFCLLMCLSTSLLAWNTFHPALWLSAPATLDWTAQGKRWGSAGFQPQCLQPSLAYS